MTREELSHILDIQEEWYDYLYHNQYCATNIKAHKRWIVDIRDVKVYDKEKLNFMYKRYIKNNRKTGYYSIIRHK